ncbi:MAG TPA: hemerythrin domain-containing protein, partial [Gaiellaceae bacterium]|nr:hemerythrin domain-containing protein [Gaiellaceae bacterium]
HLTADLEVLYPALEMHLRPGALDRMARDHARAVDLERRLITTGATDTTALQEALYDLQGLLETHFRKEEEIFLPLLADESDEELERISTAATRAAESGRRERMVA